MDIKLGADRGSIRLCAHASYSIYATEKGQACGPPFRCVWPHFSGLLRPRIGSVWRVVFPEARLDEVSATPSRRCVLAARRPGRAATGSDEKCGLAPRRWWVHAAESGREAALAPAAVGVIVDAAPREERAHGMVERPMTNASLPRARTAGARATMKR